MSDKNRKIYLTELKDPVVFVAMGFGSGLSPKAPGTAGTLMAVPLVYFLQQQTLLVYILVTLFVLLTGSWICGYATKKLQVHDRSEEHTSEIQSRGLSSYAGFCLKKKKLKLCHRH